MRRRMPFLKSEKDEEDQYLNEDRSHTFSLKSSQNVKSAAPVLIRYHPVTLKPEFFGIQETKNVLK